MRRLRLALSRAAILAFAAAILPLPPVLADDAALPQNFGKASLNMTDSQIKSAFPDAEFKVADATNSNPPPTFHYSETNVSLGKIYEMDNCKGRLQFYEHQLMTINVDCGNPAKTEAALRKSFGAPGTDTEEYLRWTSAARTITFSKKGGGFILTDNNINQAFNTQMLLVVMQGSGGQSASGTPAPTQNPTKP